MFRIYVFVVLLCYILYYCGTVLYDLYTGRKTDAASDALREEEAIDISDELEEFQPIVVLRPPSARKRTVRAQLAEQMMTGGIETNLLVPKISDFSKRGKLGELGQIISLWTDG